VKWEPVAIMIVLLGLGLWVVYGPSTPHELRAGAVSAKFTIGAAKGELEILGGAGEPGGALSASGERTFRFLPRDGTPSRVIGERELRAVVGDSVLDQAIDASGNRLFRILNITGWWSFAWLTIGFIGQMLFFGRMLVQWMVSERMKQSHIPESFWWFSFFGGVMLFTYFAWRQDPVGVLGQTSGVVIYARNIRLIRKQARRAARSTVDADVKGPP
jgi:lipid-A-disaccharide synthase-like uncharacterized protein